MGQELGAEGAARDGSSCSGAGARPAAQPTSAQADSKGHSGLAGPGSTGEESLEHIHLRLEFISDRQTRGILVLQKLGGLLASAVLIWELTMQTDDDSNSLLRTNQLEWLNIGIGSVCLALLLCVGAWFGHRMWAAAARVKGGKAAPLGTRKRYLLVLTSVELGLHTLNLCLYLAINIYSLEVQCGWFDKPVDALALLSMSIWNTLLCLNVARPLVLLPRGSWRRLRERWRARKPGRLRRLLSSLTCCSSGCCSCSADSGGRVVRGDAAVLGSKVPAGREADPEQPPQPLASFDRSFSLGPVSRDDAVMASWVHAAVFALLWVPAEGLILVSVLGSMGYIGGDSSPVMVCPYPDDPDLCFTTADWSEKDVNRTSCRDYDWDCSSAPIYTALSIAVGALFIGALVLFVALMAFVLAEYRRLPYTPYRVMNVAARLQLRTRMLTTLFFIICLTLIFYLNNQSCDANVELWLGLGPMMISMANLLTAEAFLYSPSAPQQSALRLHSTLQQFAWTEAAAPEVQAKRGLPDEPLFCFETALKACYFALHSYRHFRPESTVSSLHTAMALYGCTHYEWLREPANDMNCLLCWGPRALVITFRGTQSLANIRADAQFWRSPHPPRRGVWLLGTQPLVHTGFLDSWRQHGLDQQVLQRVRQILAGEAHGRMAPFGTTVVRCCSREHEDKGEELAAAAEAALKAEAAAASAEEGGDMAGYDEGGEAEEGVGGWSAELAGSAAQLAGQQGQAGQQPAACGQNSSEAAAHSSSSSSSQVPFRILMTGHSLGGAEATLCGMDLARELPGWGFVPQGGPIPSGASAAAAGPPGGSLADAAGVADGTAASAAGIAGSTAASSAAPPPVWLTVVTFGAPRTGNHAFAREYRSRVPDSWSVICDQDLVAKSAKFLVLFKRPGNVVLINPLGDLIVSPSFLEHNVQRSYRASVKQHLLASYNQSWAAILRGQHKGKGLSGGAQAMALLAANPAVRELLLRPLAIRKASLRRYIMSSDGSRANRSGTATATGQDQAPAVHAVVAGSEGMAALEGDLSGDLIEAAAEALDAEGCELEEMTALQGMQRAASVVKEAVEETLRF